MSTPRALVLRAPGTNCDEETAEAWRLAGASVETLRLAEILESPERLARYAIVTFPGGFSFGDDLGAGLIFASRIARGLNEPLRRFHERGGLILGICNGFQILVKAGLLPGGGDPSPAGLAWNDSGRFECRWVTLLPRPGLCAFVADDEPIEMPVAHGEGRFLLGDRGKLAELSRTGQVVFRYADESGNPTESYPANPNGSPGGVAGVCDPSGRILGLMPHPERHLLPWHHPRWTRSGPKPEGDGLRLFRTAVRACG